MKPSDRILHEASVRLRKKDAYALLTGTFFALLLLPAASYMFFSIAQVPFMSTADVSEVEILISCFGVLLAVLLLILFLPVFMGYKRIAFLTAYGKDAKANDLLYYLFSNKLYKKTMKYYFSVFLRKLPVLLPLCAVSVSLFVIDAYAEYYKSIIHAGNWFFACLPYVKWILTIVSAAVYLTYSMRYYCAPYLYMLNRYSIKDCIKISVFISKQKGYKSNVLKIGIKLIPYYLLSLLIVPCFFVIPKIRTVFAVFEKWMIASYKDAYTDLFANKQVNTVS